MPQKGLIYVAKEKKIFFITKQNYVYIFINQLINQT